MFKKLLFISALFWITEISFAENIKTTIEINNVIVDGGLVYVAVYSNENDYKAENPLEKFILEPVNNTITCRLELFAGEYVVSVFQDTNGNGKLDNAIFGIPAEPVGKTNYNLKGAPGSFNKLKVPINANSTKLTINMGRVRPL